ncbi:MAG: hypothetical protein COV35_07695 [Alphaproteobacteria bacterium CG11_big_fil_rev_8_21_14_0_20_39_49]|nr:MAG: hypothetical protein COV35_07695 [Alphaproteobacteria bacterium CG11_big_fil_rev_8_21_14_0_20_39_49]
MLKYLKRTINNYKCRRHERLYLSPFKSPRKDPTLYGEYIWFVRSKIAKRGRMYVSADKVNVDNGALVFIGSDQAINNSSDICRDETSSRNPEKTTLIIAAGQWKAVYLTSRGHAASVLMWDNEVDRYHG